MLPKVGISRRQYLAYPNIDAINSVIDLMFFGRNEERNHKASDAFLADVDFAMKLLDFSLSRREAAIWPGKRTFYFISKLLNVLNVDDVGSRFELLLSKAEMRQNFSSQSDFELPLIFYNRVLRGLWQEAKSGTPREASKRALRILNKLEVMSTPLLLSDDKLRGSSAVSDAYNLRLRPSEKTYEIVLMVCADTNPPSEHEMAAAIATDVYKRATLACVDSSDRFETLLRQCLDRLPTESRANLVLPKELLATGS